MGLDLPHGTSEQSELLQRALQLPAGDRLALATEILESVEGLRIPNG